LSITTDVVSSNPTRSGAGWWFSQGTPVSSTNKTDHHDITEILLKVALNTITKAKPNLYFLQVIKYTTFSIL
jgi:hypothetical protein